MTLTVRPLHPLFAAEISGVDLCRPIDAATQREIERAMDEFAVGVLPDQPLGDEQQIAFARLYGPLEVSPIVQSKSGTVALNARLQYREIFDVSNLDEQGRILDSDDA